MSERGSSLGDLMVGSRGEDGRDDRKVEVYRAGRRTDPSDMSLAGSPYGTWSPEQLIKGEPLSAALKWSEPQQNAWHLRILDCRPLTLTSRLITRDPRIAESFADLRESDGSQHTGLSPANASRIDCDLHYPFNGESSDGPLFLADVMEDKWDIYLYDGHLYFARSWSGELRFRAKIDLGVPEAKISWVEAELEGDFQEPAFVVRAVDFLMKSHLYGREVPHPISTGFSNDPETIARFSMSMFGRWASFAAVEDTTLIRLLEGGDEA
jgi:hypothetical protein